MSATLDSNPELDRLRATLAEAPPFCNGTLELQDSAFEMWYGKETARFTKLSGAKADALDALEQACEAARFGRNDATVLDETYRKAGKMDAENFSIRFDVVRSGLLNVVRTGLLAGQKERSHIRAEMYKLNVYGEGAFFKPHRDTPQRRHVRLSRHHIPYPPQGRGARPSTRRQGVDVGRRFTSRRLAQPHRVCCLLRARGPSNAVWAARHRYIQHVLGQQWPDRRGSSSPGSNRAPSCLCEHLCSRACAFRPPPRHNIHAECLPQGGTIGFGLRHAYPFPKNWQRGDENPLTALYNGRLKGGDAALFDTYKALRLQLRLKLMYEDWETQYGGMATNSQETGNGPLFLDRMVDGGDQETGEDYLIERFVEMGKGESLRVFWVTPRAQLWNKIGSMYISYGNEAILTTLYMKVCLLVTVDDDAQ